MQTNSQRMAQAAYQKMSDRRPGREYRSFAREFPTLVHACGLAQAVAFAQTKGGHQSDYLSDLVAVLKKAGYALESTDDLARATREASVTKYVRMSRDALSAADWLKRYVEAVFEQPASAGDKS